MGKGGGEALSGVSFRVPVGLGKYRQQRLTKRAVAKLKKKKKNTTGLAPPPHFLFV